MDAKGQIVQGEIVPGSTSFAEPPELEPLLTLKQNWKELCLPKVDQAFGTDPADRDPSVYGRVLRLVP